MPLLHENEFVGMYNNYYSLQKVKANNVCNKVVSKSENQVNTID